MASAIRHQRLGHHCRRRRTSKHRGVRDGHDGRLSSDLLYLHADIPAPSQVKADKQREVRDGHDGTWVAHPALVGVALDIFNAGMRTPNQVQSQSGASA